MAFSIAMPYVGSFCNITHNQQDRDTRVRGRQVFFEALRLHGVDTIFGNPGTTESPLLDSLMDYPEMKYIVALHEGVAVGAANFHALATGKPVVANMHVAPGLGNAIGMIYGALKANSPVVVTAGAQDTRMQMRAPLLGHDLAAMAAPVVKWSTQVNHADEMGPVMQRAFRIATQHPAGPVFVALPINVMEQETEVAATAGGDLATNAIADAAALEKLAGLVKSSRKPVIVAGDDVAHYGATESLVQLSERLGAGVFIELLTARVSFPMNHRHFFGRLGADHKAIRNSLGDADLVLLVGGPFFEEVWHSIPSPFAEGTRVIQIEQGPDRLARNFPVSLGVSGDISHTLRVLTGSLEDDAAAGSRRKSLVKDKQAADANAAERFAALAGRQPMAPIHALKSLSDALPENIVLVDESITAENDVVQAFQPVGPGDFYAGRGGGIGQGVAGALGAAVAHPDRPVVAISGDGSAMYSIQSLWTAAHHDLNILFVILANREYRVLKHNVDAYRIRFDAPSNKPYPHMDLSGPVLDFVGMAAGMGVPGAIVSWPEDIKAAVDEAMARPGPSVLELVVEGKETRGDAAG